MTITYNQQWDKGFESLRSNGLRLTQSSVKKTGPIFRRRIEVGTKEKRRLFVLHATILYRLLDFYGLNSSNIA